MSTTVAAVGAVVVTLAVIGALTLLVYQGKISGEAYLALVGPLLGAGAATGVHNAGVRSGARAARRTSEEGY